MRKSDFTGSCLVMGFLLFFCIFFAVRLDSVNEEIRSLKRKDLQIQKLVNEKCQETESRCERMTDTCLDIISNKRWE